MTSTAPVRRTVAALACAVGLSTAGTWSAAVAASIPLAHRSASHTAATAPTADPTTAPVSVTIIDTAPETLTKSSGVTVKAQVRNTGQSTLKGAKATLTVGRRPLDSLGAQKNWMSGTSQASNVKTAETSVPDVAPGAAVTVSLTLPSGDLDLSYTMATLPMKVDVGGATPASTRSFLTWSASDTTFTKMSASVIVPIVMPDDPKLLTATGAERFAAWNKAIGPGSPIDELLSANPRTPVTWLIDPALLDAPVAQDATLPRAQGETTPNGTDADSSDQSSSTSDAAGESSSESPSSSPSGSSSTSTPSSSSTPTSASSTSSTSTSGSSTSSASKTTGASSSSSSTAPTTEPKTVADLTARLRTKLTSRPSSQQVAFTPYGDPDLAALTAANRPAGSDAVLTRALARPLNDDLRSISSTVLAAPATTMDEASTQRLRAAWKKAYGSDPLVIMPSAGLNPTGSDAVTDAARRTRDGLPVLEVNSSLGEAFTTSDANPSAGAQTAAASLAIYQQQPTTTRTLAVMADREPMTAARLNAVTSALLDAPWVQPAALDLTAPGKAKSDLTLPRRVPTSPSTAARAFDAADLSKSANDLATLGSIVGSLKDSDDVVPAWSRNLDQSVSTHWRGRANDVDTVVDHASSSIAAIPGLVDVLPSRINFFSDSGSITVAVKNGLARDVQNLDVTLTPRTYAVRFRDQPNAVNVPALSQASVRVRTVAQAAQRVGVDVSMKGAGGRDFGERHATPPLEINARPTGTWIFWVLGIVALLVFCYGLVRGRQKGTRRRDELARDIQL